MPLFVHVLFWGVGVLGLIAAAVYVFYAWVGGVFDGAYSGWVGNNNPIDRSNVRVQDGNWWYRNAERLGVAIAIAVTLGWLVLLSLFIQLVAWIYS